MMRSASDPDAWLFLGSVLSEGMLDKGQKPSFRSRRIDFTNALFGCFFKSSESLNMLMGVTIYKRSGRRRITVAALVSKSKDGGGGIALAFKENFNVL